MTASLPPHRTRSAVLITASEPEPRTFGKQIVIGGLLDHLVERLGPQQVHVILVGRIDIDRPPTAYQLHVLRSPSATEQLRAASTRVLLPPNSSLQEAALWTPRLLREIGRSLEQMNVDLEIWDTMRMGQYARKLQRRRRVLYADDLFSKRYASILQRIREDPSSVANPLGEFVKLLPSSARRVASQPVVYTRLLRLEQRLTAKSEEAAPQHFDTTILVSAEEVAELAERTGRSNIRRLLPLIRSPRHKQPRQFDGKARFIFLGGLDFPPNRDGLNWFLTSCREAVLDAVPDFELLLVGRGSDRLLPQAQDWGRRVRPLGWIDDLDDVLLSVAGLVSPLRTGSGIKIKVLDALARGLPVVATPFGLLGLGVGPAEGCLIANTPTELALALAELTKPERNAALSAAAQECWEQRFSPSVVSPTYDEVLGLNPT